METLFKPPFYDLDNAFTRDLSQQWRAIRSEFEHAVEESAYVKWPETFLYNEGWNIFGLRYQQKDFEAAHQMCPVLSSLVKKYDHWISTAGFSILNPGTIIKPHVGYTDTVLRCHLGIKVPEGNCYLKVGGEERRWGEGNVMIFDDTLQHEAWNKTTETRIVLLIDLYKNILQQNYNI